MEIIKKFFIILVTVFIFVLYVLNCAHKKTILHMTARLLELNYYTIYSHHGSGAVDLPF